MFVYSLISWEEMRSLPIFFAWVSTLQVLAEARRDADGQPVAGAALGSLLSSARRDIVTEHSRRTFRCGGNGAVTSRSDVRTLCEPPRRPSGCTKYVNASRAVDLDDRDPLAVARLELRRRR